VEDDLSAGEAGMARFATGKRHFSVDRSYSVVYDAAHSQHEVRRMPVHCWCCSDRAELSMQTPRVHASDFLITWGYVCLFYEWWRKGSSGA